MDSVNRIGIICDYWFLFWDFCPVLHTNKPLSSSLEQYHRPEKQDSCSRVKPWLVAALLCQTTPHWAQCSPWCQTHQLVFPCTPAFQTLCVCDFFVWLVWGFVLWGFGWFYILVVVVVVGCLFVCLFLVSAHWFKPPLTSIISDPHRVCITLWSPSSNVLEKSAVSLLPCFPAHSKSIYAELGRSSQSLIFLDGSSG